MSADDANRPRRSAPPPLATYRRSWPTTELHVVQYAELFADRVVARASVRRGGPPSKGDEETLEFPLAALRPRPNRAWRKDRLDLTGATFIFVAIAGITAAGLGASLGHVGGWTACGAGWIGLCMLASLLEPPPIGPGRLYATFLRRDGRAAFTLDESFPDVPSFTAFLQRLQAAIGQADPAGGASPARGCGGDASESPQALYFDDEDSGGRGMHRLFADRIEVRAVDCGRLRAEQVVELADLLPIPERSDEPDRAWQRWTRALALPPTAGWFAWLSWATWDLVALQPAEQVFLLAALALPLVGWAALLRFGPVFAPRRTFLRFALVGGENAVELAPTAEHLDEAERFAEALSAQIALVRAIQPSEAEELAPRLVEAAEPPLPKAGVEPLVAELQVAPEVSAVLRPEVVDLSASPAAAVGPPVVDAAAEGEGDPASSAKEDLPVVPPLALYQESQRPFAPQQTFALYEDRLVVSSHQEPYSEPPPETLPLAMLWPQIDLGVEREFSMGLGWTGAAVVIFAAVAAVTAMAPGGPCDGAGGWLAAIVGWIALCIGVGFFAAALRPTRAVATIRYCGGGPALAVSEATPADPAFGVFLKGVEAQIAQSAPLKQLAPLAPPEGQRLVMIYIEDDSSVRHNVQIHRLYTGRLDSFFYVPRFGSFGGPVQRSILLERLDSTPRDSWDDDAETGPTLIAGSSLLLWATPLASPALAIAQEWLGPPRWLRDAAASSGCFLLFPVIILFTFTHILVVYTICTLVQARLGWGRLGTYFGSRDEHPISGVYLPFRAGAVADRDHFIAALRTQIEESFVYGPLPKAASGTLQILETIERPAPPLEGSTQLLANFEERNSLWAGRVAWRLYADRVEQSYADGWADGRRARGVERYDLASLSLELHCWKGLDLAAKGRIGWIGVALVLLGLETLAWAIGWRRPAAPSSPFAFTFAIVLAPAALAFLFHLWRGPTSERVVFSYQSGIPAFTVLLPRFRRKAAEAFIDAVQRQAGCLRGAAR